MLEVVILVIIVLPPSLPLRAAVRPFPRGVVVTISLPASPSAWAPAPSTLGQVAIAGRILPSRHAGRWWPGRTSLRVGWGGEQQQGRTGHCYHSNGELVHQHRLDGTSQQAGVKFLIQPLFRLQGSFRPQLAAAQIQPLACCSFGLYGCAALLSYGCGGRAASGSRGSGLPRRDPAPL